MPLKKPANLPFTEWFLVTWHLARTDSRQVIDKNLQAQCLHLGGIKCGTWWMLPFSAMDDWMKLTDSCKQDGGHQLFCVPIGTDRESSRLVLWLEIEKAQQDADTWIKIIKMLGVRKATQNPEKMDRAREWLDRTRIRLASRWERPPHHQTKTVLRQKLQTLDQLLQKSGPGVECPLRRWDRLLRDGDAASPSP